jgi:hypothetical protein
VTRVVHRIDVDRIEIVGPGVDRLDAGQLRQLVQQAIVAELGGAPLPSGPTMRASVRVDVAAPAPSDAAALARYVAGGVARALIGRPGRG